MVCFLGVVVVFVFVSCVCCLLFVVEVAVVFVVCGCCGAVAVVASAVVAMCDVRCNVM